MERISDFLGKNLRLGIARGPRTDQVFELRCHDAVLARFVMEGFFFKQQFKGPLAATVSTAEGTWHLRDKQLQPGFDLVVTSKSGKVVATTELVDWKGPRRRRQSIVVVMPPLAMKHRIRLPDHTSFTHSSGSLPFRTAVTSDSGSAVMRFGLAWPVHLGIWNLRNVTILPAAKKVKNLTLLVVISCFVQLLEDVATS